MNSCLQFDKILIKTIKGAIFTLISVFFFTFLFQIAGQEGM